MNRGELFNTLYNAYVKAYPDKKKRECQLDATNFWNERKGNDNTALEEQVNNKIKELHALQLKKKGKLLQLWGKSMSAPKESAPTVKPAQPIKEIEYMAQPSSST